MTDSIKEATLTKSDLEELLRPKFGESITVDDFSTTFLTEPGDNYGSTMLAVEVILGPNKEKLPLVAKLLPPNEMSRQLFQCHITVRKEIDIYTLVSPEFSRIQRENGVPLDKVLDVFPECYGARATRELDIGQPADEGSAILLENLKISGYENGDRIIGLDLKHSELVMKKLARFHATAIAIKIKKPQVFKQTVLKTCKYVKGTIGSLEKEQEFYGGMLKVLKAFPVFNKHINKISAAIEEDIADRFNDSIPQPREPFASIVHNDFWTNNMMFQYKSKDHKNPIGFKIVDYQVTFYGSPLFDLIFFLFTSTKLGIVSEHFERLVKLYYDSLVDCLSLLDCDIRPFSFEKFQEELEDIAPQLLTKNLMMLLPITMDKTKDMKNESSPKVGDLDFSSYSEEYIKKSSQVVTEYVKRGWL
uniref:CHK kinase-like domain-containing protein n=1 Tax=Timema shepardi TaxID=629360 RepID=A0A7R9AQX8_TIMSH|nr:unnamed protein product [Timema shepardi]